MDIGKKGVYVMAVDIGNIEGDTYGIVDKIYKKSPSIKKKYRIRRIKFALTREMRAELLSEAKKRPEDKKYYLILLTQLETGMRVGEVANLTIPQVNIPAKIISIVPYEGNRYVTEWSPKTENSIRTVPLTDSLARRLSKHIKRRNVGYVFESSKGKQKIGNAWFGKPLNIRSVIRKVNEFAKACPTLKKNIGTHALRRTFASYMISMNDIDIGTVSRLLGHASILMTMKYLFDIENLEDFDKVRAAVEKMNV